MPYSERHYTGGYSNYSFPSAVKWLLISNVSIFVVFYFSTIAGYGDLWRWLFLVPREVLSHFAVWQLVTYLFLHSPFSFDHILYNMLGLWFIGTTLEQEWGPERFLKYYLLCGVGAGICVILANLLFSPSTMSVPTMGASGAVYGLVLAFAMIGPDRTVLFGFVLPIKAKYLALIVGAIAFLGSFQSGSGVSHIAHLGGMLCGYLYLKTQPQFRKRGPSKSLTASAREWYTNYKREQARKKFEVYRRKTDRDRYTH